MSARMYLQEKVFIVKILHPINDLLQRPRCTGCHGFSTVQHKWFLFTMVNGIYTLDSGLLDLKREQLQEKLLVYSIPSSAIVNIESVAEGTY